MLRSLASQAIVEIVLGKPDPSEPLKAALEREAASVRSLDDSLWLVLGLGGLAGGLGIWYLRRRTCGRRARR